MTALDFGRSREDRSDRVARLGASRGTWAAGPSAARRNGKAKADVEHDSTGERLAEWAGALGGGDRGPILPRSRLRSSRSPRRGPTPRGRP
jgi:hypothetical protein